MSEAAPGFPDLDGFATPERARLASALTPAAAARMTAGSGKSWSITGLA